MEREWGERKRWIEKGRHRERKRWEEGGMMRERGRDGGWRVCVFER